MYYYIEGKAAFKEKDLAVIDCSGVGYACHTSAHTLQGIEIGQHSKLFTYLYVREDALDLYGFSAMDELQCFKQLLAISGVGPKAALAVLSVISPSELAMAVLSGDEKPFTAAQGVGKRLAQRIVLELKDKITNVQLETVMNAPKGTQSDFSKTNEAISALEALGYLPNEANAAVCAVYQEEMSVEEIVKNALKRLAE